ncbi:MAG: hypothetical protein NTU44_02250 [Bacteroidetes bacterium]|nr:hypothetical protein [Bacteroidota bacterium]
MNNFKYYIALITITSLQSVVISQTINYNIIIAYDSLNDNTSNGFVNYHVYLKTKTGELFNVLNIDNYRDEFKFNCIITDTINNPFVVFTNYGSAAGVTMVFILDIINKVVYRTPNLMEDYYPILQTFDLLNKVIKCVLFDINDCGHFTNIDLVSEILKFQKTKSIPQNIKTIRILNIY